MATLNLYKEREPHIVKIEVNGEEEEFKLPTQYTGEEAERLLEAQIKINKESKKEVENPEELTEEERLEKLNDFWDAIYKQLLILFNHYHPEITLEDLKSMLSRDDALKIQGFHRQQQKKDTDEDMKEDEEKGKKKQQKKD